MTRQQRGVVLAAALGTLFESYDFALCLALAAVLGSTFFPAFGPSRGYFCALASFVAGFAMRPVGALLFGSLGDRAGRTVAYPAALAVAGVASPAIGLLPGYATIGAAAPAMLVALRLLQGVALGGGYGGAVTLVAEYAPQGSRGAYTSAVQAATTGGLLLALLAMLAAQGWLDAAHFADWGWRLPFLFSPLPLAAAAYVRRRLGEPPAFRCIAADERRPPASLREALTEPQSVKNILAALLGGTAAQAALWYCGGLYALQFLTRTLALGVAAAGVLVAAALLAGTAAVVLFGWVSDRVGRRAPILIGCLLAVVTYFPMFRGLTHFANPALEVAIDKAPVALAVDPVGCSVQFDPLGVGRFSTSCDIAKRALLGRGVPFQPEWAPPGAAAEIRIGRTAVPSYDGAAPGAAEKAAAFDKALTAALRAAGYPASADPARIKRFAVAAILVVLALYAALVAGPLGAMLTELFPARIRYTSVSLAYQIGHAWFAGLLPSMAAAIVAYSGNIYYGLWYPISIAAMSLVVGVLFLPETKDRADDLPPPN